MTPDRAILGDGTRIEIRPIRPDDAPRIQAGLLQLSERTRYLRFHGPRGEFSREELRFLTEVDGKTHFALVALAVPGHELVAVGRFIRASAASGEAELAMVVADDVQGKGLGELLLSRLRTAARHRGITRFTGSMVEDNFRMRGLLRKMGARIGLPSRGVCPIEIAFG